MATNPMDDIMGFNQSPVAQPQKTNPMDDIMGFRVKTGEQSDPLNLIKKYFPQQEWGNAYRVMMGESGGRPSAVGDNYPIAGQTIPSYGLFQIRALPGRPEPATLLSPEENVKYAADLFKRSGWGPWTAARKLGLTQ